MNAHTGTPKKKGKPEKDPVIPAGLFHTSDKEPGITRRVRGRGFSYSLPDGGRIAKGDLVRIKALAIPPAYSAVWICARPDGHLQATGKDVSGRKQYRYHPEWAAWRSQLKYDGLADFRDALGRLRRKIRQDLKADAGERAFALAAVVFLIDRTALRVGDEAYLRDNGSYGATNLLSRHIRLTEGRVRLSFRGKGGKRIVKTLADKRLHRILGQIGDLPGKHLFSHIDPDGEARQIHSHEVNDYIGAAIGITGATAKTFRTWSGTLAAFETALRADGPLTRKAMAEAAAERLSNTSAICKASYIHPLVLDLSDDTPEARHKRIGSLPDGGDNDLRLVERKLLTFLIKPRSETDVEPNKNFRKK
jgi:DNA topoisomerase-1